MPLTPAEQQELDALELAHLESLDKQGQLNPNTNSVIQEQHPKVGFGQRFVAKNFANSPEDQINYLKSKNPDLEVSTMQGQIVIRGKGEPWRVLDPSGADLQDVTDLTTDVGTGVGTGLATAAGGIAGAPLGPGALATAGAAGAASSGGLEALRQKVGQYLGVPQKMDYGQVGTQAAFGAVSPLVFGTGATAGKIASKALASEIPMEAVKQSQRGLVSKGAEKFVKGGLPAIGEALTGVPKKATQTFAKDPQAITNLNEGGVIEIASEAHDKVRSGLASAKQKVGEKLEAEIGKMTNADGTPKMVNVGRARAELDNIISKLENKATAKNPEVMEQITELKAARDRIFSEVSGVDEVGEQILTPIASEVSPKHAFELQELLSRSGDLGKIKDGLKGRFTSTQAKADKEWAEGSRKAYNVINDELSTATENVSKELKGEYKNYIKLQNNLNKYFSTPEKTLDTLKGINNPGKDYLRGTLKEVKSLTGVDITPEADTLQAYKYFNKPAWSPMSGGGTTSTSRSISGAGIGGALGYKFGGMPGALTGAAVGGAATSPGMLSLATRGVSKSAQMLSPAYNAGGAYSPMLGNSLWNMIKDREK